MVGVILIAILFILVVSVICSGGGSSSGVVNCINEIWGIHSIMDCTRTAVHT